VHRLAAVAAQVQVPAVVVAEDEVEVAVSVPVERVRRGQVAACELVVPSGITAVGVVPLLGVVVPELVDDDALTLLVEDLDGRREPRGAAARHER